jgi:hypothetical protein
MCAVHDGAASALVFGLLPSVSRVLALALRDVPLFNIQS